MWFWSMKTGLSIHETPMRGITPTTGRKGTSEIPFYPCWKQHYPTGFISFYVLRVWKGEEAKQDCNPPYQFSPNTGISSLYLPHMEMATGYPNCLGTTLECRWRQICNPRLLPPPVNQSFHLYFICIPVCVSMAALCQAVSDSYWDWKSAPEHSCEHWRTANKSTLSLSKSFGTGDRGDSKNSWLMLVLYQRVPSQLNNTRRV